MNSRKLVIHTQYRENYGAHNWDGGEGKPPQHWKNKGGGTYVFDNITPKQESKITVKGIPTLSKLINKGDEYFTEHIIHYHVTDAEVITNPWEYDSIRWLEYHPVVEAWYYTIRHDYNPNDPYRVVRTEKL
jgi:hypothetical protein